MDSSIFQILAIGYNCDNKSISDVEAKSIRSSKTGFFISSQGYFITSGRIINNMEDSYCYAIVNSKLFRFEVIEYENKISTDSNWRDYAICKIIDSQFVNNSFLELSFTQPASGSIAMKGFTRELIMDEDDKYLIKRLNFGYGFYSITGSISSFDFTTKSNRKKYKTNNALTFEFNTETMPHAMCGSPAIDEDGNVIGIFCSGQQRFNRPNIGRILKLNTIKDRLSEIIEKKLLIA